MPVFTRRTQPPLRDSYNKYRDEVREDFVRCCAYCLLPEDLRGGEEHFHIDHYHPRVTHPHRVNAFENLYWACARCNSLKGPAPDAETLKAGVTIVDTVASSFDDHYEIVLDGEWNGRTPSGKYTAKRLRLNSPNKLSWRRRLNRWAAEMGRAPVDWNRPSEPQVLPLLDRPT